MDQGNYAMGARRETSSAAAITHNGKYIDLERKHCAGGEAEGRVSSTAGTVPCSRRSAPLVFRYPAPSAFAAEKSSCANGHHGHAHNHATSP